MSKLAEICSAIADMLRAEVPELEVPEQQVHLNAPWDPELLAAAVGERHLAVYPRGDVPVPLVVGGHEIRPALIVLIWEGVDLESSRKMLNEQRTEEFLDLHQAVMDRFYRNVNGTIGGLFQCWYAGVEFPQVPGSVRWMRIDLQASYAKDFT